jgi:hypothetical protein
MFGSQLLVQPSPALHKPFSLCHRFLCRRIEDMEAENLKTTAITLRCSWNLRPKNCSTLSTNPMQPGLARPFFLYPILLVSDPQPFLQLCRRSTSLLLSRIQDSGTPSSPLVLRFNLSCTCSFVRCGIPSKSVRLRGLEIGVWKGYITLVEGLQELSSMSSNGGNRVDTWRWELVT